MSARSPNNTANSEKQNLTLQALAQRTDLTPDGSAVLEEGNSICRKEGTMHRLHNPTEKEAVGLSIMSEMRKCLL